MSSLDQAIRRNRGTRLLPEYLRSASKWLSQPAEAIVTLSLDETDLLRQSVHAVPYQVIRFDTSDARARVERFLGRLRWMNESGPMVLLPRGSEFCGGLLTSLTEVIDHAFDILQLDGEDIRAYGRDGSRGLWLIWETEVAPDGARGRVLELRLIGRWKDAEPMADARSTPHSA